MNLCPSQLACVEDLAQLLPAGDLFVIHAGSGLGKSTMLSALHDQHKGALISATHFLDRVDGRHPMAIEEAYCDMLLDALKQNEFVFFDDLHLVEGVVGCSRHFYPRCGMFETMLTHVCEFAQKNKSKLVFASAGTAPTPLHRRCYYAGFNQFTQLDYRFLCKAYLGDAADTLDYDDLHRFAPRLNAHQIRSACSVLGNDGELATDQFIEYLLQNRMASNVALREVEHVSLADLKGVESTIQSLETHVIIPFENTELIKELNLRPKKGVLLYGPPGTGKTSVGRALAHRLKGKFFLIDGTFISGTREFYGRINEVFEAAKQNAPSIIFIDDSDVIWEDNEETGLYRYLLTQMDGLENDSPGMVCVMMTAMDVGKLPPALVRSGRVELWLEMSLPDTEARSEILGCWIGRSPDPLRTVDMDAIVAATDGFTGADLRRLTEDAKNLYAYDRASKATVLSATDYYIKAATVVQENKAKQMAAEAKHQHSQSAGSRMGSIAAMMAMEHMSNSEEL